MAQFGAIGWPLAVRRIEAEDHGIEVNVIDAEKVYGFADARADVHLEFAVAAETFNQNFPLSAVVFHD
jgi:hypothetical protein